MSLILMVGLCGSEALSTASDVRHIVRAHLDEHVETLRAQIATVTEEKMVLMSEAQRLFQLKKEHAALCATHVRTRTTAVIKLSELATSEINMTSKTLTEALSCNTRRFLEDSTGASEGYRREYMLIWDNLAILKKHSKEHKNCVNLLLGQQELYDALETNAWLHCEVQHLTGLLEGRRGSTVELSCTQTPELPSVSAEDYQKATENYQKAEEIAKKAWLQLEETLDKVLQFSRVSSETCKVTLRLVQVECPLSCKTDEQTAQNPNKSSLHLG